MRAVILMPLAGHRGGAEFVLYQLLRHGRGRGIDWMVIFLEDGPLVGQVEEFGARTRVLRTGRLRQAHEYVLAILRVAAVAREEEATVVVGWMSKGQLYAGCAAALARRPCAWYQLGVPSRRSWLERAATALPTRCVLTCSRAGAEAQSRLRPRRAVRVVYPGIDLTRFDARTLPPPRHCRIRLGLPPDGPVIGIVGRLQWWKGMHVLIEAMPMILKGHPGAHCIVVGERHDSEPGYLASLEDRARRLDVMNHLTLAVRRSEPETVQAMDVVVHASDNEPFGLVVIEAMALGKPVVAGNQGGPTEIISHGVDGLLSPFGDHEALGHAVLRFLDDPDFARAAGHAARERAEQFSAERYTDEMIRVITGLRP